MGVESKETKKTETKRTVKDSVFCNLFGESKYLLQLYQALHPEDKKVREDDLKTVTLENIFTDSIYNDLGFVKGNKLMVPVEAQHARQRLRYQMNFLEGRKRRSK